MSYLQTLDTHNYDRWIHQNFHKIEKTLPEITKDEFFKYLNEIIELANESRIEVLIRYVPQTLRKNDIDGNTNYSCNMLAARIWKTIRDNPDAMVLFLKQYIDMYETNGFCSQGQSNRYIQVYLAFNEVNL